jgi:hypothetical protein
MFTTGTWEGSGSILDPPGVRGAAGVRAFSVAAVNEPPD